MNRERKNKLRCTKKEEINERKLLKNNEMTNNIQLKRACWNIVYFRDIFMRNNLPGFMKVNECTIMNLDNKKSLRIHWMVQIKND